MDEHKHGFSSMSRDVNHPSRAGVLPYMSSGDVVVES